VSQNLTDRCDRDLLREQVATVVVSANLGHSDIQVTLNTYSHVTPALQRRAAEAMDEVLGKELIESRELVAIP
jgi:integrase